MLFLTAYEKLQIQCNLNGCILTVSYQFNNNNNIYHACKPNLETRWVVDYMSLYM